VIDENVSWAIKALRKRMVLSGMWLELKVA